MPRPTEIASKAMGKLKSARQAITGGVGIFQRLAEDHGEISTLMRRVAASHEGSHVRAELFPTIRMELLAHARAEEKEVYSVFRAVPELAARMDRSVNEHETVARMLEQLTHMSMNDERWMEVFRELLAHVHEHVIEEEQVVFPIAKDALTRERSEQISESFLRQKEIELNSLRAY